MEECNFKGCLWKCALQTDEVLYVLFLGNVDVFSEEKELVLQGALRKKAQLLQFKSVCF